MIASTVVAYKMVTISTPYYLNGCSSILKRHRLEIAADHGAA
jgi:hypothetical protein